MEFEDDRGQGRGEGEKATLPRHRGEGKKALALSEGLKDEPKDVFGLK